MSHPIHSHAIFAFLCTFVSVFFISIFIIIQVPIGELNRNAPTMKIVLISVCIYVKVIIVWSFCAKRIHTHMYHWYITLNDDARTNPYKQSHLKYNHIYRHANGESSSERVKMSFNQNEIERNSNGKKKPRRKGLESDRELIQSKLAKAIKMRCI